MRTREGGMKTKVRNEKFNFFLTKVFFNSKNAITEGRKLKLFFL